MKKLLTITLACIALAAIAGTNDVEVTVTVTGVQAEQLKFLKRYYGSSLATKHFATNVIDSTSIKFKPEAEFVLSQRRERITSAMAEVDDTAFKALENALGLPPMTNSVPLP